jgi:nucleotide-binding universal stress UspA family protein
VDIAVAALIWAGIVVACMVAVSWLALRWGRDPFGWTLLAAVLGPLALIALAGTRSADVERPQPFERGGVSVRGGSIVAAVDGSESGLRVARYIAAAHPNTAEVALIAVVPREGGLDDAERQRKVQHMAGGAQRILEEAGFATRVVTGYGSPGETIVRAANEEAANVVVVGRRGAGLSKALLGSTSDYVVKHSSRPVAVID